MPRLFLKLTLSRMLFAPGLLLFCCLTQGQENTLAFSTDQVARGETLYRETCQICHGNRLSNGQFGTPLKGGFFTKTWKGKTLGDLVQHVWEKMPPDNVQSLSWDQVTDVVSFILANNKLDAGETAMTTDMELLNQTPLPWQ